MFNIDEAQVILKGVNCSYDSVMIIPNIRHIFLNIWNLEIRNYVYKISTESFA